MQVSLGMYRDILVDVSIIYIVCQEIFNQVRGGLFDAQSPGCRSDGFSSWVTHCDDDWWEPDTRVSCSFVVITVG
jgi:hypothetical protein